jgi:8-oxo-dGTP diphosphatase
MTESLHVAVAVVQRRDGAVLVAERAAWRHQGDRLEFPGGKVEPDESVEQALARELEEEIGLTVVRSEALIRVVHDYPERSVELEVRRVTDWRGDPRGAEGQGVRWLAPGSLDSAEFPAANRPIVAALRLPALQLVTPEPPADAGPGAMDEIVERVDRALAATPALVRFRAAALDADAWMHGLERLRALVAGHPGSRLVANAPRDGLDRIPGDVGVHLPARMAADLAARPVGRDRLLSCACHGPPEIRQAERIGADIGCLGPVRETRTHPGMAPLGWAEVRAIAGSTDLPLYAIGGLAPDDLAQARAAGAIGVAGIRAFLD